MNADSSTNNTEPTNWRAKLILFLLISFGAVALGFLCNHIEPIAVPDRPWEVYFSEVDAGQVDENNPPSLEKRLVAKLAAAETRIDAALYQLKSKPIAEALIEAHGRNVTVRLVTETEYADERQIERLQAEGIPIVNDAGYAGLMHNKFVVIDERYVWTGSYNTTYNGAYKNNNNVIHLDSVKLADNFTQEFEEMFNDGEFGRRSEKRIPHPQVTLSDGTQVFTYFSPENDTISALLEEITSAKRSIYFMAFSFTHDELGAAIRERFKNKITVAGVFEERQINEHSEYESMKEAGILVLEDKNNAMMHHKVMIIDGETVITGSYNFSKNAAIRNCENLLIIKNNPDISQAYLAEFQRVSTGWR